MARPPPLGPTSLALAVVAVLLVLPGCASPTSPSATVDRYLSAWSHADYSAMAALVVRPPSDFVTFNRQVADDLDLERATYRPGTATVSGSGARVSVTGHLVLVPFGPLVLHTTLRLTDTASGWRVL